MAVDPMSQMLSGITNSVSQQADYPPAVSPFFWTALFCLSRVAKQLRHAGGGQTKLLVSNALCVMCVCVYVCVCVCVCVQTKHFLLIGFLGMFIGSIVFSFLSLKKKENKMQVRVLSPLLPWCL